MGRPSHRQRRHATRTRNPNKRRVRREAQLALNPPLRNDQASAGGFDDEDWGTEKVVSTPPESVDEKVFSGPQTHLLHGESESENALGSLEGRIPRSRRADASLLELLARVDKGRRDAIDADPPQVALTVLQVLALDEERTLLGGEKTAAADVAVASNRRREREGERRGAFASLLAQQAVPFALAGGRLR